MAIALAGSLLWAQTPLKIRPTRGDGAFNNLKSGLGQELEVEVRDENDRPVSGAEVTFLVPIGGAGGSFPGSGSTYKTTTDESGAAKAPALRLNPVEGRFNIKVTATKGDRTGTAVLSQVSTSAGGAVGKPGIGKGRLLLGVAGTAASVGILLATRSGGGGSSSTPARPPTTLSVGAIAVGGPR
ncbi:MAG: hypothetical protein U0Q16_28015 [Bryobacteraceae bacterium]